MDESDIGSNMLIIGIIMLLIGAYPLFIAKAYEKEKENFITQVGMFCGVIGGLLVFWTIFIFIVAHILYLLWYIIKILIRLIIIFLPFALIKETIDIIEEKLKINYILKNFILIFLFLIIICIEYKIIIFLSDKGYIHIIPKWNFYEFNFLLWE